MATILIVDDEKNIRAALKRLFDLEGHRCLEAADGGEALRLLERHPVDLVILDLEMPGPGGFAVLAGMREAGHDAAVVVLTGHGSIDKAVQAVRQGAHDFLEKPPDPERLMLAARNALRLAALGRENRELRGEAAARHRLVGTGPKMAALRRDIARAAGADSPVLITGESGTGKELVARAVHDGSARREGPFVAVNCAAIPADLFESELFGHEKGAFTGALRRQVGRFERASGGTLFLDEIGEMPTGLQAKLLRALDTRAIERVGGDGPIAVDARIVAATNRDLAAALAAGSFRSDLFYRVAVLPIAVPPLRARREEIPMLADHFFTGLRGARPGAPRALGDDARRALAAYTFPGNVRELKNLVERLALTATGETVTASDVAAVLPRAAPEVAAPSGAPAGGDGARLAGPPSAGTLKESLRDAERALIVAALAAHRGQMARTARALGLERSHLYRKLKALGIPLPE